MSILHSNNRKAVIEKLNKDEGKVREKAIVKVYQLADTFVREGIKERNELSELKKALLNPGSGSFSLSSLSKSAPIKSRSKSRRSKSASQSRKGGKKTKKRRSTK